MTLLQTADLLRQALWQTFWVCLPLLATGFVIGLAINLLQILTSLQDSSFSAVPRLLAFLVAAVVTAPWMLMRLVSYVNALFSDLGRFAH